MSTKILPYLMQRYCRSVPSTAPAHIKISVAGLGVGLVIAGLIGVFSFTTSNSAPDTVEKLPSTETLFSTIAYEETVETESERHVHPKLLSSEIEAVTMYDVRELVMSSEKVSFAVPAAESGAKRWMDYRTITARSSMQWKLQQDAWTDEYGFRRYGDYYMIAMGTYYSEQCGKLFEITLENGFTFLGLISDIKQDRHTDSMNQHKQGNVVEFIVDKYEIPYLAKAMGDMSWAFDAMNAKITSIREIKINS